VDVELVEAATALLLELNLEFILSFRHRQAAHRTGRTDARTSPRTGRCSGGELPLFDDLTSFGAEGVFVIRHRLISSRNVFGTKPDATGLDAELRHNQGAQWKAGRWYLLHLTGR
jgi:hypothetical protein